MAWYVTAWLVLPFAWASQAAQSSPAISAARVAGEYPPASSQRSSGVDGPLATR